MAEELQTRSAKVLAVLNPNSGNSSAGDVRQALGRHFPCEDGSCQVLELGDDVDLTGSVREAVARGVDLVVAAGGDGTVSAVANGLLQTEVPLGIIPLGTANVLARELGVPIGLDDACSLLAGPHATRGLDAMQVGDRVFFTQVGIGIDALMIRDTGREQKQRFGRIAYLSTAFTHLLGFQPRLFEIEVDGRQSRHRASQVLVANGGILGQPPFRWGPNIRPDDGRVDVCIVRARTLLDYMELAWHVLLGQHRRSPNVRYLAAERAVIVRTRRPLPVQADGEIIGETPVQVKVVPHAVRVIVPVATEGSR
jgi:YegS/Rv2252/BmrU family lipid kinase